MDLRTELQQHLGAAYVLGRELGGGGMSRVFVADEVRLGRQVVVKVLSPELAQGLNVERFEREIRLAASLQQANIVPLHSAGDVGGLPYFTMPFVEGESLRARLGRGALPMNEVVPILRDVTRALAYAHARGVVHRDIKPDNVLLSGDAAVVTDFGIAKAISASRTEGASGATLTQLGTSLGTPAYMAPEQVAGDPNVDHRADLYALGCMAFELLTGRQPFGDRTPQRMLAAHLTEAPPAVTTLRPDCSPALAEMVGRLMAKNPDERPQSATDLYPVLDASTTTSGTAVAFSAPGMFKKALLWYAAALVAVAILAKAAVVGIGLPDWVFPGAILTMALGLPALLATAYVQRVARQTATATPTLTPGGTSIARGPQGTMATMALKASPHLTWRRATRGGYIALGVFVLTVAGFMTLRAMGIGPWGSLLAAGRLNQDDKIVVADFTTPATDSALGPILAEAVRAALGQSKAVRPMQSADVAGILQQMTRPRDSRLDLTTAREVATRAGAAAVLSGRLARAGDGYVVSLDLSSAADGATLATVQGSAGGPTDLLPTVDKLTRKLRGQMGESLKQVQRSAPLARVTTSSLAALRKYTEAARDDEVLSDYPGAVRAAREAVALDSTFALAWRKLAVALSHGHFPRAAQDSALAEAVRYADRLPDREKYLVLGTYYLNALGDRARAIAAYQRAYTADSSELTVLANLASLFERRRQFDSALRYARRAYTLAPSQGTGAALALLFGSAGEPDSALQLIERIDSGATSINVYSAKYFAFLGSGQRDSALAVAYAAEHSGNDELRDRAHYWLSGLHQTTGRLRDASAADSAFQTKLASRTGGVAVSLEAENDIRYRNRPDAGVRILDRTVASDAWKQAVPAGRPYNWIIPLYALAGRPDRARALMAAYRRDVPTDFEQPAVQPALNGMNGEIELAEGKYPEALRSFRAAQVGADGDPIFCAACGDYNLGRVYDRMGEPDSAMRYFNAYLAETPANRDDIDWAALAGIQKRLGELYDSKGDTASAVKHYGAFTELWKDADPDLQPVVTTVKKRLGELTSR
ncbi:MAG TPA: protein kinase [Gemmatimonadales bacterium]|nr:protein kinase [Gemmatimonadales bacterium]